MSAATPVRPGFARAATKDDVLHSGSWEPVGQFEIYVDPQNIRLVGHALVVMEDLVVEALATQLTSGGLTRGSVSIEARHYVASNLALIIEEVRVGSFWARTKLYVRKDLTGEIRAALIGIALEAMIAAVPTPFGWNRVDPTPPSPPAEVTACDPRALESIMSRMTQTMPAGGELSYKYKSPTGTTCEIHLKAPKGP